MPIAPESAGRSRWREMAGAVPLPKPVELPRQPIRSGYLRHYEFRAERPECLIQSVAVQIVYYLGDQWLVAYRSRYHEYFELAGDGVAVIDRHDFDVVRDGWRQAAIEELRRKWLPPQCRPKLAGRARLVVRKNFVLGRGQVVGGQPTEIAAGVRFGFLAQQCGRNARARILLHAGAASAPVELLDVSPLPTRDTAAGSGLFIAPHGWRACERYRYDFACLSGSLQEDPGYRSTHLAWSVTS